MNTRGDEQLHKHWLLLRRHLLAERLSALASAVFSCRALLNLDGALVGAANDQKFFPGTREHIWPEPSQQGAVH